MEILIRNRSRKKIIPADELRKMATRVMKRLMEDLPFSRSQVSLLFTDDEPIRCLNKKYRHVDRPTDVLSFPMLEIDAPQDLANQLIPLGDIVISLETAARQASEAGHSLQKELAILLCHGFLHLLHYDDQHPKERRRMFAEQKCWLRRFEEEGLFQ